MPIPTLIYNLLADRVSPEILVAPAITRRIYHGTVPELHPTTARYLRFHVCGWPWTDHVALVAVVLTIQRSSPCSVVEATRQIHQGLATVCPGLTDMTDWDPEAYLGAYLAGTLVTTDSRARRWRRVMVYRRATQRVHHWIASLPPGYQRIYQRHALPLLPGHTA